MYRLLAPVGREVIGSTNTGIVDFTVDLAERADLPTACRTGVHEPEDKRLVRLRIDRRNATAAPAVSYLESGAARQLAAALTQAAAIADDLDQPPP
jgi:hypothetical protein